MSGDLATFEEETFPITLLQSGGKPSETYFAADGSFSLYEGLEMWIGREPINSSPFREYRVFFECAGAVYMGVLELQGETFQNTQSDGSVVDYDITLNQAAAASLKQGAIPAAVGPGSEFGSPSEVMDTVDLFGIGGHGINGSLAPADLRAHYNVPSNLDGAGETIAIIDAGANSDVIGDLKVFSEYYGLPVCEESNSCFQHVYVSATPVAPRADWGPEIALDTQMVHGIAPRASIILVTAASDSREDLITAINYAAAIPGVTAISMSFNVDTSPSQQAEEDASLANLQSSRGLIFFASSGDFGSLNTAWYPASSPYVTAVGGTTVASVGWKLGIGSELAWEYSGGGSAPYLVPAPAWQASFLPPAIIAAFQGGRTFPDVAGAADWNRSPYGVYLRESWGMFGGTSMATPMWAGMSALFAQYLGNKGQSLAALVSGTPGGFNGLLYQKRLVQSGHDAFYDVVSGSNDFAGLPCSVCMATVGYDEITGLGAPNAAILFGAF
jgi:subtilase family serine protease